jgi:CubicO group peptidase (beta-lactamase class C family)
VRVKSTRQPFSMRATPMAEAISVGPCPCNDPGKGGSQTRGTDHRGADSGSSQASQQELSDEFGHPGAVLRTATMPNVAWTAGAMISTRDDLRIWARVLAAGTLLKPETHKEQTQFGLISDSGGLRVAYGLGIARIGKFVGHNGAILGYSTAMFYLPGADATFVLAGNQASNFSNATTDIFYSLAKHLFAQDFGSPT